MALFDDNPGLKLDVLPPPLRQGSELAEVDLSVLIALLPRLRSDCIVQALAKIGEAGPHELCEAVNIVAHFANDAIDVHMLAPLASVVPESVVAQATQVAADEEHDLVLEFLVQLMPPSLLYEVGVPAARSIRDIEHRARVLVVAAMKLQAEQRAEIASEALELAQLTEGSESVSILLAAVDVVDVVDVVDDPLRALNLASELEEGYNRAPALAAVAQSLPTDLTLDYLMKLRMAVAGLDWTECALLLGASVSVFEKLGSVTPVVDELFLDVLRELEASPISELKKLMADARAYSSDLAENLDPQ
jgi:hypothetical protein